MDSFLATENWELVSLHKKEKHQPFPPGKVQEIEVAVRSAAQHTPAMLDIKHRVPFDDVTWHHGQWLAVFALAMFDFDS